MLWKGRNSTGQHEALHKAPFLPGKSAQWPFFGISPTPCWGRVQWDDAGTWDTTGSGVAHRSRCLELPQNCSSSSQALGGSLPGSGLRRFMVQCTSPAPTRKWALHLCCLHCSRSLLNKALVVWLVCYQFTAFHSCKETSPSLKWWKSFRGPKIKKKKKKACFIIF